MAATAGLDGERQARSAVKYKVRALSGAKSGYDEMKMIK